MRGVFTAKDVGGDIPVITMRQELLPEFQPYQQPVIAKDKVRYVGEPIAVVVADSAALAEDALEHVRSRSSRCRRWRIVRRRARTTACLFETTGRNLAPLSPL